MWHVILWNLIRKINRKINNPKELQLKGEQGKVCESLVDRRDFTT